MALCCWWEWEGVCGECGAEVLWPFQYWTSLCACLKEVGSRTDSANLSALRFLVLAINKTQLHYVERRVPFCRCACSPCDCPQHGHKTHIAACRLPAHPAASSEARTCHQVALSNQEREAVRGSNNTALHFTLGTPQPQSVQGQLIINCGAGAGDPRVTVLGYWHRLAL